MDLDIEYHKFTDKNISWGNKFIAHVYKMCSEICPLPPASREAGGNGRATPHKIIVHKIVLFWIKKFWMACPLEGLRNRRNSASFCKFLLFSSYLAVKSVSKYFAQRRLSHWWSSPWSSPLLPWPCHGPLMAINGNENPMVTVKRPESIFSTQFYRQLCAPPPP